MSTGATNPLCVALLLESDGPGGAENMLLQLAEELRCRGHTVVPVGPADGCGWLASRFRDAGFIPETFALRRRLDWRCVSGLAELIRRRRVDVVHSHEFTMAIYGAAAAIVTGSRHIITMHGNQYFADRWLRRQALRWAFRASSGVVAVSNATKVAIHRGLRMDGDTIRVIPNGVRFQSGSRDTVRHELEIADGEALVVAVGNLYPVKGHINLLRGLALVRRQHCRLKWRVAIAGRGGEETNLKNYAAEHGISDRVHLLGHRDDIPDVLAAADIFVMPSMSEGLPLALLEAMHARVGIVATRVGGIPEIVRSGKEAILTPPGDEAALANALMCLIENSDYRQRLGRAAERRAHTKYSVQVMTDAYERLYYR